MYSVHSSIDFGINRRPSSSCVRAADVPSSEKEESEDDVRASVAGTSSLEVDGIASRGKGELGWRC